MKTLSGPEIAGILEKHGWVLHRSKGSHFIYKKEGQIALITIPIHGNKPLKPGTLRSILKAAQLSENEI